MSQNRRTSYDVRIWSLKTRSGRERTTHQLRWVVEGKEKSASFATRALADSKRSELLAAMRRGEPFDIETGMPLSSLPDDRQATWWEWSLRYVDLKWPTLAPRSRRSTAEALITVTLALLKDSTSSTMPPSAKLRSAMFEWAFNAAHRVAGPPPTQHAQAIAWLSRSTRRMGDLQDPAAVRAVLDSLSRKLDDSPAAATTYTRKRAVFFNAMELAVEEGIFQTNPILKVKRRMPKQNLLVDPRVVASPAQAQAVLARLADLPVSQQVASTRLKEVPSPFHPLLAFFGLMYYSALRPSEAIAFGLDNMLLPDEDADWGQLSLSHNDPEVSDSWTDSHVHQRRQLKHRAVGAVRPVPCPPALVKLLRQHLELYGTAPDGRLFRGPHGGRVAAKTYASVWQAARTAALTERDAASPLIAQPYDLRHTAVSTWLAAGVDSAQVAAWAGHTVAVLHTIYAHVVPGREQLAREKITAILHPPAAGTGTAPDDPRSDSGAAAG